MRRVLAVLVLAAAVAAAGCGGGSPTKAADPPGEKGKPGKVVTPDPA